MILEQIPHRIDSEFDPNRGSSRSEKTLDAGILMPAQYTDLVRRNHTLEGELKLLMAVLEDAIRCYLRNVDAKEGGRRREFIEVKNWFENKDSAVAARSGIFSFENLCDALGLEPHRLLTRLGLMTIQDLPSRRYQMRRHRALSSLRSAGGTHQHGSSRSRAS